MTHNLKSGLKEEKKTTQQPKRMYAEEKKKTEKSEQSSSIVVLLYSNKQSMWELCNCIELTLILWGTGITVDKLNKKNKLELHRIPWNFLHILKLSFKSFILFFLFFWRRKSTEQYMKPKSRNWIRTNRLIVYIWSILYDYAYLFNRSNWSIFSPVSIYWKDHFQSYFFFSFLFFSFQFFLFFFALFFLQQWTIPWICFDAVLKEVNERESIYFNWITRNRSQWPRF